MKSFLLGAALVVALMSSGPVQAQTMTQDQRAYSSRIQSLFNANAPAMAQFATLLRNEAALQNQLQKHTITQKQYEARAPKPAAWRAVIPKVKSAVRQFTNIKPVPPSMADVNKGLQTFAVANDRGLTKLNNWTYTRKPADFKAALTDLGMSYMSLMKTARLAKSKMEPKPR